MSRVVAGSLWLAVGAFKMAALVLLIDGDWQRALLSLMAAWAFAAAALFLRHLRRV